MSQYVYQERRFFSIVLGCDAARISVPDSNRDEHYAVVPMRGPGSHNRWVRERTLETLAAHIARGDEPGEVEIDLNREAALVQ